jgi:hypothetical protein
LEGATLEEDEDDPNEQLDKDSEMDENRDILDLETTSTTMKKGSKEEEDGYLA